MGIKTILVEDSKTIRDTLIPAMAELGDLEVVAVAETAREAIDHLSRLEGVWQLAVVDLFLKQGSGLDVLRACGSRRRDRIVVVLSNYATDEMRKECRALGADRVFDKSTELDAFFDFCASHFSFAERGEGNDGMHGAAIGGSAVSASQTQ
jgi:DNA-binding NarL/FixJ family response regulator